MDFLFITSELRPKTNANSAIAYRIADTLRDKYHCTISFLGFHSSSCETVESESDAILVSSIEKYQRFVSRYKNRNYRYFQFLLHPGILLFRLQMAIWGETAVYKRKYAKSIKKAISSKKYDAIIAFSRPVYAALALSAIKEIPYWLYLLDPLSTHYQAESIAVQKQISQIEKNARGIFVTDLIFREAQSLLPFDISHKMISVDFPNIVPVDTSQNELSSLFQSNEVNLLFCGAFYSDIRNPAYVVQLMRCLEYYRFRLFIVGQENDSSIFPPNLPGNIQFIPRVSQNTCNEMMCKADFLLNVGNTIPNQMPSKIISYIATGKPIINITKIDDCPTLKYTQKYPLALSICESDGINDNLVQKIVSFCQEHQTKRIAFEDIEIMYHTCTPEYVAYQVMSAISAFINPEGDSTHA